MKNKVTACLLAWFFGGFGIHKFYLGQTKSGLIRLLFFWTFIPAFIALIDIAIMAGMSEEDFNRKYNTTK